MRIECKWAKAAAVIASLNLAAPQVLTFAADAVKKTEASKPHRAQDVVLTTTGELNGRVVTATGEVVDGANISLLQNGKPVAKTNSNANGEFQVAGLKGGVYQVSAGQSVQLVRAWNQETAPPSALPATTIVQGQVVRGQDEWDSFETDEMVIAGIATAGLIVGIAALVEANDDSGNGVSSP